MSVSPFQSPLPSEVLSSSLDSLSPPPPPAVKKARIVFSPRGAAEPPTPTFFPMSQSLLHGTPASSRPATVAHFEATDKKRLEQLASTPVPRLRLQPSSRLEGSDQIMRCHPWVRGGIRLDEIPKLPWLFEDEDNFSFKSIESSLPLMPVDSEFSASSKKTHTKLPPFKSRGGLNGRVVLAFSGFAAAGAA